MAEVDGVVIAKAEAAEEIGEACAVDTPLGRVERMSKAFWERLPEPKGTEKR